MERELELVYLWSAVFENGHCITQPEDDRYSKHDPSNSYNPSAFRDVLDYSKKSPLKSFGLINKYIPTKSINLTLDDGKFITGNGDSFKLEAVGEELADRQIIYYRTMQYDMNSGVQRVMSYNIGYKGKDKATGKVIEKVITIDE